MSEILDALGRLSAAEEFFDYLAVPYDQAVVHVNRLHILKRFNQYLRTTAPNVAELRAEEQRAACRKLLIKAYEDFVRSTPAREKVFKVFRDADGPTVNFDSLRGTLPSRKG